MQMYSKNALRWVISAILLLPLPYNGALKVFSASELRGVMTRMCPHFPVHYLALLQSQEPQVLMAIFFTFFLGQLLTCCSDSLGPTVHAHVGIICLCLFVCRWKPFLKPDVPRKISFCLREWTVESDVETVICYINKANDKMVGVIWMAG